MDTFEERQNDPQELDILILIDDVLRQMKRLFLLGVALILLLSGALSIRSYLGYTPVYTAYASFTVRVANPLHAGTSGYNTKTAEQMAKTFPHNLTSGVLQDHVKKHLGIFYVPSVSVTANANTSVITMRVSDADPQLAYDVLNAVIECYPEVAEFVVGAT